MCTRRQRRRISQRYVCERDDGGIGFPKPQRELGSVGVGFPATHWISRVPEIDHRGWGIGEREIANWVNMQLVFAVPRRGDEAGVVEGGGVSENVGGGQGLRHDSLLTRIRSVCMPVGFLVRARSTAKQLTAFHTTHISGDIE